MDKTIKNVVLFGTSRCGKTTIAKRIVKELDNFSFISEDNFKSSFIKTCEELDITSINLAIPKKQCLNYCLESMYYEDDLNYVIEFSEYSDDIIENLKDNSIILFLGYPNLSSEELFNNIRKYDKPNEWTYIEPDGRLKTYCDFFIEESKELEKIAKENNYWYVDVSKDREKVLQNTFEKIKDML